MPLASARIELQRFDALGISGGKSLITALCSRAAGFPAFLLAIRLCALAQHGHWTSPAVAFVNFFSGLNSAFVKNALVMAEL